MSSRLAGLLEASCNGNLFQAKGNWTYNLGKNKRDAIVGSDRVHGYKELPQVPFIEGEATDAPDLDVEALQNTTNATITLNLANGKTIVLREAWYAHEGGIGTEEANIPIRFEGMSCEEVRG
jgi:hypothetical protein